ncbi:MAG TPA: peptidase M49 [Bacteroidota bacterium]|nr:peptidase M49 [Bacteroidota bacterium]
MATTAPTALTLERVGPARVVRLTADGFDRLTPKEKIFCYYLSQAAIAGRDIAVDQHHPDALELRDLLEELFTHPAGIDPDVFRAVGNYLRLFWINNGFYDTLTSAKFLLECTFGDLQKACRAAVSGGARFNPSNDHLDQTLERFRHHLFDPEFDRQMTNKSPGEDWIRGSGVNFYGRGITADEVSAWADRGGEQHPLNASVLRKNGRLYEEVWRAGSADVPPGRYARELSAVIGCLEQALPYAASERQAQSIRLLIRFFQTGDQDDFRKYNIHWITDDSPVDFIFGFIEVYIDPRSRKGEWESSVLYTDPGQTALMQGIASRAQYFEDRAPWAEEYRKHAHTIPLARAVDALFQTGGTGPISPIGINLPNEQSIRQAFGSKSVLLRNVADITTLANGRAILNEFAFDREEIGEDDRYGIRAGHLHTALHEIAGHGSGKVSARLEEKDPSHIFPGLYSTLEETRADLVALWHAWDPELIAIGVAKDREELEGIAKTMYRQAILAALTQLRRIGKSERLEEDHMRNRQLIAHYIMANSRAVETVRRNVKTYYHIVDFAEARKCAGRLLAEVMRIKAEGDLDACRTLTEQYGTSVDLRLRDEVQIRAEGLDVASYCAFVQPELRPVRDAAGSITGVELGYPESLAEQMLGFSRFTSALRKHAGG